MRPMRKRMHDPRVIVAATGGVAALAAGAIGVAINSPTFAVVAGSAMARGLPDQSLPIDCSSARGTGRASDASQGR